MTDPERAGAIRRILDELPAAGLWRELLALLEPWPAGIERDEVEAAVARLASEQRSAPAEAWQAARAGQAPAWWPLVRHVSLGDDDDPEDEGVMAALDGVTSLRIEGQAAAWLMDGLARLPGLEKLALIGVYDWEACDQLPELPALVELSATGCPELSELAGLEAQPALRALSLVRCKRVAFASMPALSELRTLAADGTGLAELAPLAQLTGLETLTLADCAAIADLAPLAACTRLRFLDASRLPRLTSIAPLAGLARLERLWLDGAATGDLAPLAALPLRELVLGPAPRVDTASLAQLAQLQQLQLADVADVSLRALAGSALTRLFVLRCGHVDDFAALAGMPGLELLVLEALPGLHDLAPIAALPALRRLQISRCAELTDISALAAARGLEQLVLRNCPAVADASVIATLPALTRIDLTGTPARGLEAYAPRGE